MVWYVRLEKRGRIRLKEPFGSQAFNDEYDAAIERLKESRPAPPPKQALGSLVWALTLYRESSAWLRLSKATRRQRDNIFSRILDTARHEPLIKITRSSILKGYERRAATPYAARNYLEAMRGLMRWAVTAGILTVDPTLDLKAARPKSDGFPAWTDDDVVTFERRWPLGTRERLAFDILLYTGLRRGDASIFGRQHIKDGVARLTTEKTGEQVFIPIEPALAASIAAGPSGDMTLVAKEDGSGMTKESFGNWFGEASRAAGIRKSAHGLRKIGATRDAERGFTESELEAKYGWRGGQMASKYTRAMNREKLAIQAVERARKNAEGTLYPRTENAAAPTLKKV